VLLPLLAIFTLLACVIIISPKKELWVDEAYSLRVLTDPSLRHMLNALANGVDGGLPLYYVLAHAWAKLFGTSLMSLRLFSSLLMCVGVLALWVALRRAYSLVAVSLAIFAGVANCEIVLRQEIDVRFYGLYFACSALVVLAVESQANEAFSLRAVFLAIGAHAALLLSHPLGILYSAASIFGLVLSDWRHAKLRWPIYGALLSSWLVLLVWLRPIIRIFDLVQPRNWVSTPNWSTIQDFAMQWSPALLGTVAALVVMRLVSRQGASKSDDKHPAILFWQGMAFLLVPVAVAIKSNLGSSLFLDRYFLPSAIGVAVFVADFADRLLRRRQLSSVSIAVWLLAVATLAAMPIRKALASGIIQYQWLDGSLQRSFPGLPVLVEDANAFMPLDYYSAEHGRPYFYVLDWQAALDSPSAHATLQYKLMRNGRSVGYNQDRILDGDRAACRFERFVVLNSRGLSWFEERVMDDPGMKVELVGQLPFPDPAPSQVYLVTRNYVNSCPKP
jgi:hypothetical protein